LALAGQVDLGLYLILTGFNYVPLLVYAASIVRAGSAKREVADELSRDRHYVRKYSTQQFLVFVPLAVVLLAAAQELARPPRPGP
jgi:hypothetical protein